MNAILLQMKRDH